MAEVLASLQKQKEPGSILLFSSLAEGADRLAAEVVLTLDNTSLHAVLPLPVDDYCEDFPDPGSIAEFRGLLNRAANIETLEPRTNRSASYEAAGRFIVDNSDIMIAIWDGKPGRGLGGTAEIVAYARRLGRPLFWINSLDPGQWTIQSGNDQTEENPMSDDAIKTSGPSSPGAWEEAFDECVVRQSPHMAAEVVSKLTARFRKVVGHFGPAYGEAEKRAQQLQKKYRRASIAVYVLVALAVLIVSAQSIFHLNHWIIAGEVVAIALILLLFHFGSRKEWHFHWMESRLEAEWIRNGVFVAFLSGETVPGIARHWACRWVRNAPGVTRVRDKWDQLPDLEPLTEDDLGLLKDFMANVWLKNQQQYHDRKATKELATHNRISRTGEVMFWGTFVAAIIHLLPHSVYHSLHLPEKPIVGTLTLLAIGLPTLGASLAGLRSHFEFNKIASRSAMMADHLSVLETDLENVGTVGELKNIVRETETLMLQENSDWYFTIGMHHIEKG